MTNITCFLSWYSTKYK